MCGCVSWDFGGRETAPRRVGVRVCVCVARLCVCRAAGAGPRRLRGRGFPAVCVWGRGPRRGPQSGVVLPLRGRGLGASQVRTARPGPTPWTRVAVRPPRRRAAWGSGRGSRGRSRGRKRAGLQRGLTVFAPARPLAGSPARPLARSPASPDAPGTPCSRGPWALPRAWPGEGRGRDTRIAVSYAASASPKGRGRHILAF